MAGREFSGHLSQLFLLPPLAAHHLGASQLTVAHLIAMAKNSSYSKRKTRWRSKRNHIGESQLKYCATFVTRIWMACNLMLWCLDRYLWVRDPLHQATGQKGDYYSDLLIWREVNAVHSLGGKQKEQPKWLTILQTVCSVLTSLVTSVLVSSLGVTKLQHTLLGWGTLRRSTQNRTTRSTTDVFILTGG